MTGPRSSRFLTGGTAVSLALLLGACGTSSGKAQSLPSVAASPADTPTPPLGSPSPPAGAPPAGASPAGSPATPPASATGVLARCSDLKLTIASDKAAYRSGETVHLTATLTNGGRATCTFQAGAQRGFAVTSGSTAVWRSGCSSTPAGHTAIEPCPQFLTLMPIRAGQTITRTQDWSQQADGTDRQVAAGRYLVAESWAGSNASAGITIS